jgi:hypothetical protein
MIEWMKQDLEAAGYALELVTTPKKRVVINVYKDGQRAYWNVTGTENSGLRKAYHYLLGTARKDAQLTDSFAVSAEQAQRAAHAALVAMGVRTR